ncbi:hypothetical protein [Angelakisella massiliensis]|uniref:hypothetical protein n=1 Tax=Angelakisella massiliensis TaxID=1871018 RepID=UPI0024B10079|nr:hypothetical protein [Angelakisella massiliensis]
MQVTITAVFDSRQQAEWAASALSGLGGENSPVTISLQTGEASGFSAVTAATGFSNLWGAQNMVAQSKEKALLRLRCDSGQQQRMMGELAALGANRVSSES